MSGSVREAKLETYFSCAINEEMKVFGKGLLAGSEHKDLQ